MKKIVILLFCLFATSVIQAQVNEELEAVRYSELDSTQIVNYEHNYLALQTKAKLKEQRLNAGNALKSASAVTTLSKTVTITAGGLATALGTYLTTVTNLTVKGTIDARDFKTMRDDMTSLSVVDISAVTIAAYKGTDGTYSTSSTSYAANAIPKKAFYMYDGLTSIIPPTTITSIGEDAFCGCDGLTSFSIPSSVTSIGDFAFFLCDNLTSLSIASSVTSIGAYALSGSVTVASANLYYSSANGVLFNKAQTTLIYCPKSKSGSYIIPSTVTNLYNGAFYSCKNLTSVAIPSSVDSIGGSAFDYCTGLTSITIPASVTFIGTYAFWNCTAPITVNASNAYFSSVDGVLFNKNKSTLIYFPASTTSSYTIPSTVTTIGNSAFWYCKGLTNIALPSSLTTIEGAAFVRCEGLTSISIPSSVKSISYMAFYGCTGLTSIYAYAATPVDLSSSNNVFYEVKTSTCVLYVPKGSKSLYKVADKWSDFTNIQEMSTAYTLYVSTNTVNVGYEANSTASISVSSNTTWSASSNQSWLSVSPVSGSGNGTIVLKALANGGANRTATVTVSASGVGSQTITVNQTGDINADITLNSFSTSLSGCEASELTLSYSILTGLPNKYKIVFDENAVSAGFQDVDYTALPSSNISDVISITIPSGSAGTYSASIQMENSSSGKESPLYSFNFTVNVSSSYIIDKFNDVVLCDNSSGRFTAYQWFNDNIAIEGATNQYYNDPDGLSGSYYVKVTTTDGLELYTCPATFSYSLNKSQKVSISPNPLASGESFEINIDGITINELSGAEINIYNALGTKVFCSKTEEQYTSINFSYPAGNYIGHVKTSTGKIFVFKLLVIK